MTSTAPFTDILQGHALTELARLPDASVHCCVTSPPYYAVRDYGTPPVEWPDGWTGQLGLEPTHTQYVSHLADVFDTLKRVLHPSGTLWLNLGDSYASATQSGLKPKDLIGIPWRVAFELQSRGWYLRDAIIWAKANPMPSSVSDRCTSSYEMFFHLSLRPTYYFDAYAIREPTSDEEGFRNKRNVWTLPTEPSRIKHYAMMPTKLIEPAILAGSSEYGCCAECFEPYRRVLSKTRTPTRPGLDTKIAEFKQDGTGNRTYTGFNARYKASVVGNRDPQRHITTTAYLGWEPGCNCGCPDILPSVIIDPFAGAGTVGLVARRLGRSFIGIELKSEYASIAATRASERNTQ